MTDVYEIAQELLHTKTELDAAEAAQVQIPLLEAEVERIPALEAKLKELRQALFASPMQGDVDMRDEPPAPGHIGRALQNGELVADEDYRDITTDTPEQPITTVIDATEDEVEEESQAEKRVLETAFDNYNDTGTAKFDDGSEEVFDLRIKLEAEKYRQLSKLAATPAE